MPPKSTLFSSLSRSLGKKKVVAHHFGVVSSAEAAAAEKKALLGKPGNNLQIGVVGVPNVRIAVVLHPLNNMN